MCIRIWNILSLSVVGSWLLASQPIPKIAAAAETPTCERVRDHMDQGDWESAIDLAGQIIDRAPNSAEAYHLRGAAYLMCGDDEKATADIDAALRIDPGISRPIATALLSITRTGIMRRHWSEPIVQSSQIHLMPRDMSHAQRSSGRKGSISTRFVTRSKRARSSRMIHRPMPCAALQNEGRGSLNRRCLPSTRLSSAGPTIPTDGLGEHEYWLSRETSGKRSPDSRES